MKSLLLHIVFHWPQWWILLALVLLAALQFFLLFRQRSLSKKQLTIKSLLNFLTWLMLFFFAAKASWTGKNSSSGLIVYDDDLSAQVLAATRDSLHQPEIMSYHNFVKRIAEDPDFVSRTGRIHLLGRNFQPEILSLFYPGQAQWIPVFPAGEPAGLHWKALAEQGEIQEVRGQINLENPGTLRIKYGGEVADSLLLDKGFQSFALKFPVVSVGRADMELMLNDRKLEDIRFYGIRKAPMNVLFILRHPDFESKTLAEWLGKNGHRVEVSTEIAKDALSKVSVNDQATPFVPDLIITSAEKAGDSRVKKAVSEGKSIFFTGMTDPENEVRFINKAIGTRFSLKKVSNETEIAAGKNLTAQPYHFSPSAIQEVSANLPFALQRTGPLIGLSLLNETYPLRLSGDSLAYSQVWHEIIGSLQTRPLTKVSIAAPAVTDTRTPVRIFSKEAKIRYLSVAEDTIRLAAAPLNPALFQSDYVFRKEGWQAITDSLEVFVYPQASGYRMAKAVKEEVYTPMQEQQQGKVIPVSQGPSTTLPDWLWFSILLLCFSALWLESKFSQIY